MKIVHADIKPDNFLVRHTPSTRVESSLQLIDFGKAIDLVVEADPSSDITTVSGGRQGKYHLDYFGIAGSAYCLLFGKYIEVSTAKNRWVVKGTFKRWWQVKVEEKNSLKKNKSCDAFFRCGTSSLMIC